MDADERRQPLLPPPSSLLAADVAERAEALAERTQLDAITLAFQSVALERAHGIYRAKTGGRPLRAGLLGLACAYLPLQVSLEAWQALERGRMAGQAWAFALVAAAALVAAFTATNQRRAINLDAIGTALLTVLAWCIIGRAAYARVDPLAPPVALALLFFIGAGPSLVRLRFVSMLVAAALIIGAHAAAAATRRPRGAYVAWYELGVGVIAVLSALSCRRLERDHRREFFLLAALGGSIGAIGSRGARALGDAAADGIGGDLALADVVALERRHTPLDDVLHELRELAHRLHVRLPAPRVPTDAMERALDESGAASLADLLLGTGLALPLRAAAAELGGSGAEAGAGSGVVGRYAPPTVVHATEAGEAGPASAPPPPEREGPAAAPAASRARSGSELCADGSLSLVRASELPGYYSAYAHVPTGYRVNLSVWASARSLFRWHNETLNVWTELLPAAAFALATRRFLADGAVAGLPQVDRALLTCGLVTALLVRPLCSAAAHLFYCGPDSRSYALWWSVDYISIAAAILAVSLVSAHNSFYCEPELAHLFFVCSSGLLCTSAIAVLCTASSGVRAMSFFLFVCFCNIVPLFYQLFSKLEGWYHNDAPWAYIYYWIASLGTFALGLLVKSAAVPEACAPGAFDYVGASHQLWHVAINVAFVFGTLVPWRIYAVWRASVPCPAPPPVNMTLGPGVAWIPPDEWHGLPSWAAVGEGAGP